MAGLERGGDQCADARCRDAFFIGQVDGHQAVAVEQFQRTRRRDIGRVVEVDAEELPLRLHDADDTELEVADAGPRSQGAFRAEQFRLQLGPQHNKRAGAFRFVIRQELAAAEFHPVNIRHVRALAIDDGTAQAAVGLDLGIAPHHGGHAGDVGQAGQGTRIVECQRAHGAGNAGRAGAGSLDLAGRDVDQVGAELREFGQHEAMDAFPDRGQQNDRRDPDGDPEQRQEAAQPVCGDGAPGEVEGVGHADHRVYRLANDSTGSSCAARRAGSTPNRMPVTRAVPSPAIAAQSGG